MDRIDKLNNNDFKILEEDKSADILALETSIDKLKYQAVHLKRSIQNEMRKSSCSSSKLMANIVGELTMLFDEAIETAYPETSSSFKSSVMATNNDKYGDYQCNSSMALSGFLTKKLGKKFSPREVAQKVLNNLPSSNLVGATSIAGPGFINVTLSKSFIQKSVSNILVNGVKVRNFGTQGRVVIDYSSPNIAKEMHVGHLRSTIIGDCLANLFEYLGHDVLRLNHTGDWGTQFGMLIAHLMDEYPNYLIESPPIQDLQAFYKASKKRFDNEADFKDRAYKCVVKLQSRSPDVIKAWHMICDVSRKEFQLIYDRLSIKNLIERGESFYHDLMPKVIDELEKLGMVYVEEGRKLIFPEGSQYPLTVVKSDGGYTYDSSDLACIKQRIFEEKGDILIYVTDSGQSSHFDLIFKTARAAKWYTIDNTRVEHIGFGCVLGEDGKKFKTRSGDTVRLVDLLDEGLKRCSEKLIEKGRDKVLTSDEMEAVKKAVAYGCVKYADLSHNLNNDYIFSFDKMLDDKGNTAAYLLYAYTRIRSISRNANVSRESLDLFAKECNGKDGLKIDHAKEIKLSKCILKFPDVLSRVCKELTPHILCEFLYELSSCYTEFYDNCYCIEKDRETGKVIKVNYERLLLCDATAAIMQQCFTILGLKTVEKM